MPAVPVVVTMSITVSTTLGVSKVTGTVTVPAPSSTVTSPMVTVGTSLSVIVTVPLGSVFDVFPLVTFPFNNTVSSNSIKVSSIVITTTVTDVIAVKRSVRNLLLTNHYDRPFHPEIGSNVPHLLFENLNPVTGNQLSRTIEEMIGNFEPRARVENVECTPLVDQNKYDVRIYFYVENLPAELQEFQTILETVR